MEKAILFEEGRDPIIVSADDIKAGLYSEKCEFRDSEYNEYKVTYVCDCKGHKGPYFRLYYSYEDYKKLYPNRADRYKIVANMRRYDESQWHKDWKTKFEPFCSIEKCIKDATSGNWKFADAYLEKAGRKICVEFQYSYIAFDFEERNKFYSKLGIKTVWLYALPRANVKEGSDGNFEILEDNARGFFRISEKPENLSNQNVYIQVKSGKIYRVEKLGRRSSSTDLKSTVRYFEPSEVYTEDEFVKKFCDESIFDHVFAEPLESLWRPEYGVMFVKDVKNDEIIMVNCNGCGEMYRGGPYGCVQYKYAYLDEKDRRYKLRSEKDYSLKNKFVREKRFVFLDARTNTKTAKDSEK